MRTYLIALASLMTAGAMSAVSAGSQEIPDSIKVPLTAIQAHDESVRSSSRLMMLGGNEHQASQDSITRLIARFYVDQYRHFQDPEAPYFLMMSRDATLAMGIGGAVRMRGWYDFAGAVPYNGFIPATIPVPKNPEQRRRLGATPSGTALFFRIIGTNKALGNFSAFIQGGFSGYNNTDFKIKKSYVTINDVTIGYAPSTFVDLQSNAPVIDAAGPCGQADNTSVLVQWAHKFRHGWSMAAGVEFPKSSIDDDGIITKQINDWFPDIVAYGQYAWEEGAGHVRLSGLSRVIPYRNLVTGSNCNIMAGGAQLSAVIPVGYSWTIYGSAVGGAGIASFIKDFQVMSMDLARTPGDAGHMYAPWCYGLTAALRYDFSPKLFSSIAVSEARLLSKSGSGGDLYKYGLYGSANLFWNMSPRLQTGVEYLIGSRKNRNGESASAQRINMMFQFSF